MRALRRWVEPHVVSSGRAGAILAGPVGLLVLAAVLLPRPLNAIVAALAAALGCGYLAYLSHIGQQRVLQESRDLWGLSGIIGDGRLWPAPGGWALGADAIAMLCTETLRRGHKTLVELGPGSSSVIIGRALGDRINMYGLEHDAHYCEELRLRLDEHELRSYHLLLAPLTEQHIDGDRAYWYDPAVVQELPDEIDVLLVDGPPNFNGRGNRAPAWSVIESRMRSGGLVLVDDTKRPDERRMVAGWQQHGLRLVADRGSFMILEVP